MEPNPTFSSPKLQSIALKAPLVLAILMVGTSPSQAADATPNRSLIQLCRDSFGSLLGRKKTASPVDPPPTPLTAATEAAAKDKVAQPPVLQSKIQNVNPALSNRHLARLDDLVARKVLSQAEALQIAQTGDASILWNLGQKGKINSDELKSLEGLFERPSDLVAASAANAKTNPTKIKALDGSSVAQSSAQNGPILDDIIQNPSSLRNGATIHLESPSPSHSGLRFEERALSDFLKAEKAIVQKFVGAIRSGVAGSSLDSSKIRILKNIDAGPKGRPFEVSIIQRGHPRLLGCIKGGILTIVRYDPQAPQDIAGYNLRYKGLCD